MKEETVTDQIGSGSNVKWDYLVLTMHARHNTALEDTLKEHGQDSWELVFLQVPMPYEYQCVFRKRILE